MFEGLAPGYSAASATGLFKWLRDVDPTIFWLLVIVLLAFFFIGKRNPLRIFNFFFRLIVRGLRGLRVIKRAPKFGPRTDNISFLGPVARAMSPGNLTDEALLYLSRFERRDETEVERQAEVAAFIELGRELECEKNGDLSYQPGAEYWTDEDQAKYQAILESRPLHKRMFAFNSTLLFDWVHPEDHMVPKVPQHTAQAIESEFSETEYFFHFDVPMGEMLQPEYPMHQYFHEDIECQFIIRHFRGGDKQNPEAYKVKGDPTSGVQYGPDEGFYYVANAFRKVINSNVRRLATWQTLILTTVFFANVFYSYIYDYMRSFGYDMFADIKLPLLSAGDIFTIMLFVSAFIVIFMLNFIYIYAQRNNAREFDTYVTRYLAYLTNRFTRIRGYLVEDIPKIISDDSRKESVKSTLPLLNWFGWRAFFLQKFLRAVFYQIKRNTFNYMLLVPVAFGLTAIFAFMQIQGGGQSQFAVNWGQYRACVENSDGASGEQCRASLTTLVESRDQTMFEYLSIFSNCVGRDESNQCRELEDAVVLGISSGSYTIQNVSVEDGATPRTIPIDSLDTSELDSGNAFDMLQSISLQIARAEGITSQPFLFIFLFMIQIGWYMYNLIRAPVTIHESIREEGWQEFHELRLEDTTKEVVDRFIIEVTNARSILAGFGGKK